MERSKVTYSIVAMLRLFLDTGSHENLLALCDDETMIHVRSLPSHGDTELVPAIERTLADSGHAYNDLTHLACVLGPGGFTSLRVGVAAINTLSFALDLPSTGVHLSDFWSQRVLCVGAPRCGTLEENTLSTGRASGAPLHAPQNFLWLHSTRRSQIFVKGFGTDGTATPVGILNLEDAVNLQGRYVGELIPEHRALLTQCTPIPEEEITPLGEMLPCLLASLPYQKRQLQPWYGRGAD